MCLFYSKMSFLILTRVNQFYYIECKAQESDVLYKYILNTFIYNIYRSAEFFI